MRIKIYKFIIVYTVIEGDAKIKFLQNNQSESDTMVHGLSWKQKNKSIIKNFAPLYALIIHLKYVTTREKSALYICLNRERATNHFRDFLTTSFFSGSFAFFSRILFFICRLCARSQQPSSGVSVVFVLYAVLTIRKRRRCENWLPFARFMPIELIYRVLPHVSLGQFCI